jgi:hypothetical protein
MKYASSRTVDTPPRIVGRNPTEYAQELQEFLEKLHANITGGIPPGFNDIAPPDIEGGVSAAAGAESDGWASASHQHALDTAGTPGTVATVSAQGDGPSVSLNAHTHRLGILTTKGDLVAHNGTDPVRLPVGTAALVLTVDAVETAGVKWSTMDHGALTGLGDDDHTQYVQETTTISTTAPLTGGGDLSANRTLAISDFGGDAGAGGTKGSVPAPATGDAAAGKYLKASGGWEVPPDTTGVPTSRTISTTAPLTGGGDLTTNRTLDVSNFGGDAGAGGTKGTVPAPATGDAAAGKYLKADGTWAVPAGGGGGDHGGLTGLADDDHAQYLILTGARPMTGALDMDQHSITDPTHVDMDVSVAAGTSYTAAEGIVSWDSVEDTLIAYVRSGSGAAVVLVALGWGCLAAVNGT